MRSRLILFTAFFALGALQYALLPNVVELFHRSTTLDALAVDADAREESEERSTGSTPSRELPDRAVRYASRAVSSEETEPIAIEDAFEPSGLFFQGLFGAPVRRANSEGPVDADRFPLASDSNAADAESRSRNCSHWARFPVGSWARLRTTTISYENSRAVQSVTETRVLLKSVDVDAGRYELEYESVVKLGAFDYQRRSETFRYDFWDVGADGVVATQALAPVNLTIGDKTIPCLTRRVIRENGATRDATTIWYSNVASPYVLQKETRRGVKQQDKNAENSYTSRDLFVVQKLAARSAIGSADAEYIARSSTVVGDRRQGTVSVYSGEIPGGLLRETTIETIADERRPVLQTSTVLLDYFTPQ